MRQLESIESLTEFSKGLRDIGWGTTLMLLAGFNLFVLPLILPKLNALSTVSIVLALVGIWKLFGGKQTCWACSLEIQQRWLLSWSLFLDFALIAIRFLRRFWNPSWLAMIGSICGLISFLFLVRFIYHLAKIIDSKWGRILSLLTQFTIVSGVILIQIAAVLTPLKIANPVALASVMFFGLFLAALSLCFFLVLCFQMSYSIKGFVDFLYQAAANEVDMNLDEDINDEDLDDELEDDDYRIETDRSRR